MAPVKVTRIIKEEVEIKDLPQKIRDALESSGKSGLTVCKEIDMSSTYWYKLVNGKLDEIAYNTLQKIETALGVDLGINFENQGGE